VTRSAARWSCSTGPRAQTSRWARSTCGGRIIASTGSWWSVLGRESCPHGARGVPHAGQTAQVVEPPSSRPGTGGVGAARRWRRRSRRCRSRTRSAPGREAGDIADVVGEDAGRAGAEMPKMSIRCQPEGEYLLAQPLGQLLELVVDRLELADEVDGEPAAGFLRAAHAANARGRSRALQRWADFKAWTPRAAKIRRGHRPAATRAGDRQLRVWRCAVGEAWLGNACRPTLSRERAGHRSRCLVPGRHHARRKRCR
jgi:hypothetical protein